LKNYEKNVKAKIKAEKEELEKKKKTAKSKKNNFLNSNNSVILKGTFVFKKTFSMKNNKQLVNHCSPVIFQVISVIRKTILTLIRLLNSHLQNLKAGSHFKWLCFKESPYKIFILYLIYHIKEELLLTEELKRLEQEKIAYIQQCKKQYEEEK